MTNSINSIETLEVYVLNNPYEVNPHWVSHFIVPTANELLTVSYTHLTLPTTHDV